MSGLFPGSRSTYQEYLHDIRWEISEANLKIAASQEALKQHGFRIESGFDQIDDTLVSGFVALHADLQSISGSIDELSAKFDWGFSQLLLSLGSMNESLEALLKHARTPEQTWSHEQYAIALDAFRRGLFSEALDYVDRAIDGCPGHTGYRIDHRLHLFLGVIRLGSDGNNSKDIIDREKAYSAFLNAARYAAHDYREDAARALCGASKAAYELGRFDACEVHTTEALRLHPRLGEAAWLLAKTFLHRDDLTKGLPVLRRAIVIDPLYSVKCFVDRDCTKHEAPVQRLVQEMNLELLKECSDRIPELLDLASLASECLDELEQQNAWAWAREKEWFLTEYGQMAELQSTGYELLINRAYVDTAMCAGVCEQLFRVTSGIVDRISSVISSVDKRQSDRLRAKLNALAKVSTFYQSVARIN